MDQATKRAIADIEKWSAQVTQDPNALGNKLNAERALYREILDKVLAALRALDYRDWIDLDYTHMGCFVPTGKISVYGIGSAGERTVASIITRPGDFERLIETLKQNFEAIMQDRAAV